MPRPRSRRTLLQAAAVTAVPLAGCNRLTAIDSSPPRDASVLHRAVGERATAGGTSVWLQHVAVRESFLYVPDHEPLAVAREPGKQWLFADVAVDGDSDPRPWEFTLRASDGRYKGTTQPDPPGESVHVHGFEQPYDAGSTQGNGWIAYELPAPLAVDDPHLRWSAGEKSFAWRLPSEVVSALRSPPATFELREFSLPDAVERDEPIEAGLTVANVGDAPETFRGSLNQREPTDVSDPIELPVDPGEEVTWRASYRPHQQVERDVSAVRFVLRAATGDVERTVRIRDTD